MALAREIALEFGVGALLGAGGGIAIAALMRKLPLSGGLAALFLVAGAVFVFGAAGTLHGSAFLAVYIAGVVVGNRNVPGLVQHLSVLDAGTWLCQIVMFLVLGLLATPHDLGAALMPALGVAAFLMLVGRPLAVAACLAPFGYGKREIAFVAWVGLRGAVGIFLASIPMLMRLPNALLLFNVAFIVVLASLLVQGWTIGVAARLFDVALPHRDRAVRRVEVDLPGSLERELVGYPVAPEAAILGEAPLPGWAKLAMVVRGGEILMADAAGRFAPGDYVYLLAPPGRVYRLDWLFAPPDEAREAERELFGEFSFAASVRLGDVAAFYSLPVRKRDTGLTLGEHFTRHYEHTVEVGDRVRLGPVTLIARELDEDRVSKVGLKIEGVRGALARAQWPKSRLAALADAASFPRVTGFDAHAETGRTVYAYALGFDADFTSSHLTLTQAAEPFRWAISRSISPRMRGMPPIRPAACAPSPRPRRSWPPPARRASSASSSIRMDRPIASAVR